MRQSVLAVALLTLVVLPGCGKEPERAAAPAARARRSRHAAPGAAAAAPREVAPQLRRVRPLRR